MEVPIADRQASQKQNEPLAGRLPSGRRGRRPGGSFASYRPAGVGTSACRLPEIDRDESIALLSANGCQSMGRVGDCPSRAQGGRDYSRFDDLRVGGAGPARVAAVDIDAIRALRSEGNRYRNQLFVLYWNGTIGDGRFVECPKGFHHFRSEAVHYFNPGEVFFVIHITFQWG